ncbi:MAG TPA: DUF2939 domain-containing protein [Salinarimonas sp.]|jgi:hypothetical protein|nr:DUF2939 domain-containing protein [Salinarimonas sp.]
MRSIIAVVVGVLLLWCLYILSPLVALASVAGSVRAGDVAALETRLDVKELRSSLSRQVAAAYMRATGAQRDTSSGTPQFGAAAAAAIVDPLIAPYLTPQAIMEMMRSGRLPGAPGMPSPTGEAQATGVVADFDLTRFVNLETAKALFFASEWRGFRIFIIALPLDRPMRERYRLEMRLSGLTWTIAGLGLPEPVRDRIVQQIVARGGS